MKCLVLNLLATSAVLPLLLLAQLKPKLALLH
jgi:hypothetical protein